MPETRRKPIDFDRLKQRITFESVLGRYGVALKAGSTWRRGKCPLPTHEDKPNDDFTVNVRENYFKCNSTSCCSARKGRKGGDIVYFTSVMESVPQYEAAERLVEWFGVASTSPAAVAQVEVAETPTDETNEPLKFELKDIDHKHEYLTGRNFDEEECEYLGVGFFPGKGSMAGRVVFPIHNPEGQLIGYAGRSIDPDIPHAERWRFPKGFHRGQVLYNLHRVEGDSVIVCESFWGVMACVREGVMNAVALMGNRATDAQVIALTRFNHITLLLDGDEAGIDGAKDLAVRLLNAGALHVDVRIPPEGKQPDETTDLREMLGIAPEPEGEMAVWEPADEEAASVS
jgi:DNA primase